MRAVIVDPHRRVIERTYDEFQDPRVLQFYIQSTTLTRTPLGPGHVLVLDEFGPYRKAQSWFGIVNMPVSLAGKAVMLGVPANEDSQYAPCQYPEDAVRNLIRWFDNPAEAEALMPTTKLTTKPNGKGKVLKEEPMTTAFRTMDRQFVTRDGKVSAYDPT
jgi:hypothetical protein